MFKYTRNYSFQGSSSIKILIKRQEKSAKISFTGSPIFASITNSFSLQFWDVKLTFILYFKPKKALTAKKMQDKSRNKSPKIIA